MCVIHVMFASSISKHTISTNNIAIELVRVRKIRFQPTENTFSSNLMLRLSPRVSFARPSPFVKPIQIGFKPYWFHFPLYYGESGGGKSCVGSSEGRTWSLEKAIPFRAPINSYAGLSNAGPTWRRRSRHE
jgi:hypothetical protein